MALFYLFVGFNIWMLVDAVRRRAQLPWLLSLLVFPPAALVYFFAVKIHDYDLGRFGKVGSGLNPAAQLASLRQRAESEGSVEARLELADALEASEQAGEAIGIFEKVLSLEPKNPRGLHGVARCHLSLGKPKLAADALEQVLEQDPRYRNYSAALDYAEALWQAGERNETIDLLEGMVRETGRPNHRLALAHYANLAGAPSLAREQLEQLLQDHYKTDPVTQRRQETWATRAQDMLAELDRETNLIH